MVVDSAQGQARFMAVMQVNRVIKKTRWEKPFVDGFGEQFFIWNASQARATVETPALLPAHVFLPCRPPDRVMCLFVIDWQVHF